MEEGTFFPIPPMFNSLLLIFLIVRGALSLKSLRLIKLKVTSGTWEAKHYLTRFLLFKFQPRRNQFSKWEGTRGISWFLAGCGLNTSFRVYGKRFLEGRTRLNERASDTMLIRLTLRRQFVCRWVSHCGKIFRCRPFTGETLHGHALRGGAELYFSYNANILRY